MLGASRAQDLGSVCFSSRKMVLQEDRIKQNGCHGVLAWSLQGCYLNSQVCSELSVDTLAVVVESDSIL